MANIPQPHPKSYNAAKQVRRDMDSIKDLAITLIDVDTAILEYMNSELKPSVGESGKKIAVPVIFASAERWTQAKKYGHLRDQKGQLQLPLIMIRRNSMAKDDSFRTLNRFIQTSYSPQYSPKNQYDIFSQMESVKPTQEKYNTVFPDHITLSYECMLWTSFTEHLNQLEEQFLFAENTYWGRKNNYRFKAFIDSFEMSTEMSENDERIVKGSFNLEVKAYLLPNEFAEKLTTIKSFTPKRVIVLQEIDTSVTSPNLNRYGNKNAPSLGLKLPSVSMITEYQRLFDFVRLNNYFDATFVSGNNDESVWSVSNVAVVETPPDLASEIAEADRYNIFINGVWVIPSAYTITLSGNDVNITFDISILGYTLSVDDEVSIRGKLVGR